MGFRRCFLYLATWSALFFFIGRAMPKSWFLADRFPYRQFAFEKNGRFYERIHVKQWQNRLPDMSRFFPMLMPAKKMGSRFDDNLQVMVRKTCIAEFVHSALCVLSLRCLRLWPGIGGAAITVLYIAGNLPFILIQRYNRPRLVRLMKMLESQKAAQRPRPEQSTGVVA